MPLEWSKLRAAPGAAFGRIRMLTPGRFWEGAGIGLLAIVAGGAAMLFHGIAAWIERHTIGRLAGMPEGWFVAGSFVTVMAGSLVASWIIARFAPTAGGGGVLPVKLSFWRDFGVMRKREGVVKLVASAITLGSGVSMGPEGPSMQIGAAAMSSLAGSAGVAKQARRAWCAAGAAAGLAAVFNAPLAAITFVLEEVIGDLHSRLLGRVVVAAVVGALIGHAVLGPQPAFQSSPLSEITWRGWVLVPVVAVVAAFGGAWFQRLALMLRGQLRRRPTSAFTPYYPVVGAFISWVAGLCVYFATGRLGIFGIGYGDITVALAGQFALTTAWMLFVGKVIATAGAVGSGGCGGIFAPSLFIGAMGGATMAALTALVLPLQRSEISMLVMTGMAASLGAVIRTPLTCVLLIFEVTNQWVIVPALMLAAVVSQVVARFVNHHDMYEETMLQDGQDPHQVLPPRHFKRWREIPVSALASFKPVTIASLDRATLAGVLRASRHDRYPVVDAQGRVMGVLPRREAELAVAEEHQPRLEPPQWVAAKSTVGDARKQMLAGSADFLCVGDAETRELHGILTLHDLLRGESVLEEDAGT
ncbi:MAG TPA: chloride channel protein [Opitutaceae bacterium]|nr:chloride channel protein [Opitutaceae bacterium]